jgi:NADH-quinone oxidoreductase subunit H
MLPLLVGLAAGLGSALLVALAALVGVWAERKIAGRIQLRFGPQEAGPAGLLQTLADTLKLVLKEDITPNRADVGMFRIAPFLTMIPVATSIVVIPLASGWAPLDLSTGIVLFLAVPGISSAGALLAGWASRNTFATLGGIRAAAQMISYELPRTLAVLSACVLAGTISPVVARGEFRLWWIPALAVGYLVYFIASIAELNRGPFDIPEAEAELVAGFFADYSGIRWAIFMMGEYGGIVAASLFGAAVFFGGGFGLPGVAGGVVFTLLTLVQAMVMIWAKWTFPRMRPDQLMALAWKVLTPMALGQLLLVGIIAAVVPA